jgi:acetyltransferase-like isoleucine patch superfamily enzyme
VPPNSLVVGNPARVIESKIVTGPLGRRRAVVP